MKILAVECELKTQATKLNMQCDLNFVNHETKEVSIENGQKRTKHLTEFFFSQWDF